jgi:hypothetical protein
VFLDARVACEQRSKSRNCRVRHQPVMVAPSRFEFAQKARHHRALAVPYPTSFSLEGDSFTGLFRLARYVEGSGSGEWIHAS